MIYQLEQANRHVFHYVERSDAFEPKTGAMGGYLGTTRCVGTAYSSTNKMYADSISSARGIVPQTYNEWVFIVRSKWLPVIRIGSFIVFDGLKYEIANYDKIEDGHVIDCRTSKKQMTVTSVTQTIVLDPIAEGQDE